MPTHSENEFWFAQSANTTADLGLEVHSRFFYLSKSHTAMEINNERWFSERMNNNPKRHSRGKRNAKMKQQTLRKVVCTDCGRTVPINQARYDAEAYHCHTCLHICSACGRVTRDTMYPAFDRRGNMIEVCLDCYNASTEPCFACSVKGICGIIGNSLCQRAAIQHTTSGVF